MDNKSLCSADGCGKDVRYKRPGLCEMHYKRLRRLGKLTTNVAPKGERQRYFHEVVLPFNDNECLIWPFPFRGRASNIPLKIGGRIVSASRAACEYTHGAPPSPAHYACHSCGNGHLGCMNPRHLRWGTPKENAADMIGHGTRLYGDASPNSRLTSSEVASIKSIRGQKPVREIALQFNVSKSSIYRIYSGEYWGLIVPSRP